MRSFCRKTYVHKILRFKGGVYFGFGGGEVPILFLWALGFFWEEKEKWKRNMNSDNNQVRILGSDIADHLQETFGPFGPESE